MLASNVSDIRFGNAPRPVNGAYTFKVMERYYEQNLDVSYEIKVPANKINILCKPAEGYFMQPEPDAFASLEAKLQASQPNDVGIYPYV